MASKLTSKKYTKEQIKLSKFIEKRLTEWGFQKYERRCYTPKYGEGAYTIEDWSNEHVADLLAEDILPDAPTYKRGEI